MNALKHSFSLSVLLACFWAGPVLAADIEAGEQKAPIAWVVMAPTAKAVALNGLI